MRRSNGAAARAGTVLICAFAATLSLRLTPADAADADIMLYKGVDREQKLIDGAKQEGEIVIYSTLIVNQALRPIVDAFQKTYPFLKTSYWRATTEDIVQKSLAETRANNMVGDVLEGTGLGELAATANLGQPFYSPELDAYPERYRDPHGVWAPTRLSYYSIAYNTKLVPDDSAPKSYADLLDPRWTGKMAWRVGTGTGVELFLTSLRQAWGEDKAMDYFKKLAQQKIVNFASGSARTLVDRVIAGDYSIAINIYAHHALISEEKGAPVKPKLLDPTPSSTGTMVIPHGVHHPYAALLFADFLLSKQGQGMMGGTEYFPVRPDVPAAQQLRAVVPSVAGVPENFIKPDDMQNMEASSEKIYDDLFR
ncbi:MAG TPA: extracellular solute-binding protein [Beijerinckiaceae bacterium]|nr:extracellular solute-binding protein [Beijerinckiaceae bacterium]